MANRVQTGSWALDWEHIRSQPFKVSLKGLSELTAGGLDLYSLKVAEAICSGCKVSSTFRDRVLKEQPTDLSSPLPDTLESLKSSITGTNLLGICGVLVEYFTDTSMGEIFEELADRTGQSQALDHNFSRYDWTETTSRCGNMLPRSQFSSLLRTYTRLYRQQSLPEQPPQNQTSATVVIDLLKCMSDLHIGSHPGPVVCFVGDDGPWAAAMAEWLFDLKIELWTIYKDGKKLHTNCGADEFQMQIFCDSPGVPCDGEPLSHVPLAVKETWASTSVA